MIELFRELGMFASLMVVALSLLIYLFFYR